MKKIIITILAFCYSVSSFCQAWAMDEAADDARESEPLSTGVIFLLMIIAGIIYAIIKFRDSVEEHNENVKKTAVKKEKEQIQQKKAVALKRIADEDGVDLGLSVKWAKYNLGATSDTDFGYLLRWGLNEKGKAGNHIPDEDVVNISGNSDYDAATNMMGKKWRLPTEKEFLELINKCTWTLEKHVVNYGYRVTGPNGNSIFLPSRVSNYERDELKGDFWTSQSTKADWQGSRAICFGFASYWQEPHTSSAFRHANFEIRAVCDYD